MRWVLLETAPWGHRMRLPGHHLARWLVDNGHTVAYVSAPVSPFHFLSPSGRGQARRRWQQEGRCGQWREERLFTYIPRTWLPVHRQWPFDGNASWNGSEFFSRPRAGHVLREAGFQRADVVVVQNMQIPGLVAQLQPRVLVVRVEDEISGFRGMPRVIIRREEQLLREADLVTGTAHELCEKARRAGAERVSYLPNGVDTRLFARPAPLPLKPADFPSGPVAVYVGALDGWFDEDLLAAAAAQLPHWSFVLIGPPRAPLSALRRRSNVLFFGPRQQEEVPPYLWHAQAGLIPFRRSPLVETVCPLKLFEYLAAGLPVIATRWAEMERLGSPATLVDSPAALVGALEATREPDAALDAHRRVEYARQFDWNAIFEGLGREVDQLLQCTPPA